MKRALHSDVLLRVIECRVCLLGGDDEGWFSEIVA